MAKRKLRRAIGRRSSRRARRAHGAAGGKLPKEAVTLIVILRAREGQETLLEGALLLHEVWASREAHTEHMHTPHFLRWNARKDALLASREANFWKQIV